MFSARAAACPHALRRGFLVYCSLGEKSSAERLAHAARDARTGAVRARPRGGGLLHKGTGRRGARPRHGQGAALGPSSRTTGTAGSAGTPWAYLGAGMLLASLLLVASPTPSMGGGFPDDVSLVGSRLALFGTLVAASIAVVCLRRRLAPAMGDPHILTGVFVAQLLLATGYPLVSSGFAPSLALTVDFMAQGCLLPFLGLSWVLAYRRLDERLLTRCALGSLAVAAVVLVLTGVLPTPLASVLMCMLPLSTLLLAGIAQSNAAKTSDRGAEARGTDAKARAVSGGAAERATSGGALSWQYLAGLLCALAASNVLAGSAETGGFIPWGTVVSGYVLGLAATAVGAVVVRRTRLGYVHLTIAAVGALAVCYAASGLVMGGVETIGEAAKAVQHRAVISMELATCCFAWLALCKQAHVAPGAAQDSNADALAAVGAGFVAVNAGKALGSTLGILTPLEPATLSIVALIMFVPAAFFLAAAVFRRETPAAEPAALERLDDAPRRMACQHRRPVRDLRAVGPRARRADPVGGRPPARLRGRQALRFEEHRENARQPHLQEDRHRQPRGAHPAGEGRAGVVRRVTRPGRPARFVQANRAGQIAWQNRPDWLSQCSRGQIRDQIRQV